MFFPRFPVHYKIIYRLRNTLYTVCRCIPLDFELTTRLVHEFKPYILGLQSFQREQNDKSRIHHDGSNNIELINTWTFLLSSGPQHGSYCKRRIGLWHSQLTAGEDHGIMSIKFETEYCFKTFFFEFFEI